VTPGQLRRLASSPPTSTSERAELVNMIRGLATMSMPLVESIVRRRNGRPAGLERNLDSLVIREHGEPLENAAALAASIAGYLLEDLNFELVPGFDRGEVVRLLEDLEIASFPLATREHVQGAWVMTEMLLDLIALKHRDDLASTGRPGPVDVFDLDAPPRDRGYAVLEAVVTIVFALLSVSLMDRTKRPTVDEGDAELPTRQGQAGSFVDSLEGGEFMWMTTDRPAPEWAFTATSEARRWVEELIELRGGDERWHAVALHGFLQESQPQGRPRETITVRVTRIADHFTVVRFDDASAITFEDHVTNPSVEEPGSVTIDDAIDGVTVPDDASVETRTVRFVDSLEDPVRLEEARASIEQMIAAIGQLLDRADLEPPDEESATLIREHLVSLYRMESPPAVSVVDGNMTEAARLLHKYRPRVPDEQPIDERIDTLLQARPAGEGTELSEPLAELLTEAGHHQRRRTRLGELTRDGLADGYKKLVASCVVAAPVLAIEALGWLTTNRSYIAIFLRWVQSVVP